MPACLLELDRTFGISSRRKPTSSSPSLVSNRVGRAAVPAGNRRSPGISGCAMRLERRRTSRRVPPTFRRRPGWSGARRGHTDEGRDRTVSPPVGLKAKCTLGAWIDQRRARRISAFDAIVPVDVDEITLCHGNQDRTGMDMPGEPRAGLHGDLEHRILEASWRLTTFRGRPSGFNRICAATSSVNSCRPVSSSVVIGAGTTTAANPSLWVWVEPAGASEAVGVWSAQPAGIVPAINTGASIRNVRMGKLRVAVRSEGIITSPVLMGERLKTPAAIDITHAAATRARPCAVDT